jgi:hypothetical protein
MHGQDLRKTSVRPNWVTAVVDELADYSNRRSIFKVSWHWVLLQWHNDGQDRPRRILSTCSTPSTPPARPSWMRSTLKVQSTVGTGADLATALLAAQAQRVSNRRPD